MIKTEPFINLQLYSSGRNGRQLSVQCREGTSGETQLPKALDNYADYNPFPAECLECKVQLCTFSDLS